ncbi:hypothetical protein PRIPAC_93476, partial [Pristionchus pacificus]
AKRSTLERKLKRVVLGGRFEIETPYKGFYPEDYKHCETLFICDGCFNAFANEQLWMRHATKCKRSGTRPPGNEVYRDEKSSAGFISVFQINGENEHDYCTQLCLFATLFLKDKCVYSNIYDFDFYVV